MLTRPGKRRTVQKDLIPCVGLLMFFYFFLMVLQIFTTLVNFFHLFSNFLKFPDLRRTGEGFPSAGEQRGRRRRQRFPQMMSFSSCLQVIYIIAFAIYISSIEKVDHNPEHKIIDVGIIVKFSGGAALPDSFRTIVQYQVWE